MVPSERFELPTFGLQNRCTTTVLRGQRVDEKKLNLIQTGDIVKEHCRVAKWACISKLLNALCLRPDVWRAQRTRLNSEHTLKDIVFQHKLMPECRSSVKTDQNINKYCTRFVDVFQ